MNIKDLRSKEDEISSKRDFYANESQRLQRLLSENKSGYSRDKILKELEEVNFNLRAYNGLNKERGYKQEMLFSKVCKDSMKKEVYNRVRDEVDSRLCGNSEKIISLLTEVDEVAIENYNFLNKKHSNIIKNINALLKELDLFTLQSNHETTPIEYKHIQDYNRSLGMLKRELTKIII